jgi:hypothetical protein
MFTRSGGVRLVLSRSHIRRGQVAVAASRTDVVARPRPHLNPNSTPCDRTHQAVGKRDIVKSPRRLAESLRPRQLRDLTP